MKKNVKVIKKFLKKIIKNTNVCRKKKLQQVLYKQKLVVVSTIYLFKN